VFLVIEGETYKAFEKKLMQKSLPNMKWVTLGNSIIIKWVMKLVNNRE